MHRKPGDNPHLWYDPSTMPAYAKALSAALSQRDPAHQADYDQRLRAFLDALQPLQAKIAELRGKFSGIPVTATEPVFGYMATALGFKMRNERFQLAVMNDTEPRASDVAAIENDLRKRQVRMLFHNSQATDTAAERLVRIAREAKVPVVGVTETEPTGTTYQAMDDAAAGRGRAGTASSGRDRRRTRQRDLARSAPGQCWPHLI